MTQTNSIYHEDFYKWTKTQATLLKQGDFSKLDIEHLIEEIETLGRFEKRELESYLTNLLFYLLKIQYQPNQPKNQSRSWELSIKKAKHKVKVLLNENPSLKEILSDILNEAYFTARLNAISDTELEDEIFPEICPFSLDEILK